MTIINDTTVGVTTFEELKNILETNNTYNYIYLENNITLTNGIRISSTKTNITINGTYNNKTSTLEDKKTLNYGDTINASYQTIQKVTVCNMNIIGNNYYGIIYVPESTIYKNIVVEYNNITYTGPQISFHPNGLTRFIDSVITITDNSITTGNEVAECNKIEIGGKTTINHTSKNNSSFWFRNDNPSLTILTNSNVTFTSTSRELIYGITNLTFKIDNNATFNVTTANGLSYGTYGTGTTTIEENATFILKQTTRNGSYATWYSYGPLTINKNANLRIINDYDNITTSNYNISFQTANSSLNINSPNEIVLYNKTANIITTSNTIPFNFTYSRLNLFTTPITINDNISEQTLPTFSWYKPINTSTIKGTFNQNTTTITSNNYTEEELTTLPSLTNLVFANKKILSIGTLPLILNSITDNDTNITGTTSPNASIMIKYNNETNIINANSTGTFNHTLEEPLPIGTNITFDIKKQNNLIYYTKTVQIVYSGDLTIDAPKTITFDLIPISNNPIICPKQNKLEITIVDSRINETTWNLYISIKQEPTSSNGHILEKALIFKDNNNNITELSQSKILIATGTKEKDESKTTTITQEKETGILLQILKEIKNNTEYKTHINWELE